MVERLRFEGEIADLGLREHDTGSVARQVAIGEKIVLDVDTVFPGLAASPDKVEWVIPGLAVTSYVADRSSASIIPIKPRDLIQRRIAFHWIKPADGLMVKCVVSLRVNGVLVPFTRFLVFDVKAPRMDLFTADTSKPVILEERGVQQLRFGAVSPQEVQKANRSKKKDDPPRKLAGINWRWTITLPKGHPGEIKDVQTVLHGREKVQRLQKGRPETRRLVRRHPTLPSGHQLDQDPSDQGDAVTYSGKGYYPPAEFPMKLAGGSSFHDDSTFDSPATALEPLDIKVTVDEHFRYFVLFRPDKPGAIWAPVARADWFWKAVATRRPNGKWALSGARGGLSKTDPASTDLPIYASNAAASEWIETR